MGRKGNMTKRQGKKQGNVKEKGKSSVMELQFSRQLKWSSQGEGFVLYLQMSIFQAFSLALFFVMEITLHFVYVKVFFLHCMCLVCFENCFVFMMQVTIFFFFCFGIHFNT